MINYNIFNKIMHQSALLQWKSKINIMNIQFRKNSFTGEVFEKYKVYVYVRYLCTHCKKNNTIKSYNYRSRLEQYDYIHSTKSIKCLQCLSSNNAIV